MSMMMSTPRWSNHSRASDTATSGLFWWSADSTSTSNAPAANSCTACFVQATPVGPFTSRYGPDMSLITPMRTRGGSGRAGAQVQTAAVAVAASSERRDRIMTGSLAFRPAR